MTGNLPPQPGQVYKKALYQAATKAVGVVETVLERGAYKDLGEVQQVELALKLIAIVEGVPLPEKSKSSTKS